MGFGSMGFVSKLKMILGQSRSPESHVGDIVDAVKSEDSAKIRALLREYPELATHKDETGKSLLHITRQSGIAETLIVNGVPVNLQDKDGFTPLHYAAKSGDEAMVQQLIIGGADVTITTAKGATAGDLAAESGHKAIAQLLPQSMAKAVSASESAVRSGRN